jgi:flagellar biosynthesis protein FlhG
VASGRASLAEAGRSEPDGLRRVRLGEARGEPSLGRLLQQIAGEHARVLVDAELDADGELPLPLLADGEVVVQLSGSPASIRAAYDMLRALKSLCGRGSVSLLVTDADPVHAERVRANLFHAASRYLALPVRSIVPQESSHV